MLMPLVLALQGCGCDDGEEEFRDELGQTCCVPTPFDCGAGIDICQPLECSDDARAECADVTVSERHCGRCWHACASGEQCEDGICVQLR